MGSDSGLIIARAPLRIPLGGGGTDLPSYYSRFGGAWCSAAIDKYVWVTVNKPKADDAIRVYYKRHEDCRTVDEVQHDLVKAALRHLDIDGGVQITSIGDVPDGTGLGSSGSYCVALLAALREFAGARVPVHHLAAEACYVEMEMARHPVGKQDQYIAAFGGLQAFATDTHGKVRVTPILARPMTVDALEQRMQLWYTGITRSSKEFLTEQARATTDEDAQMIEGLHLVRSLGLEIRDALEQGNLNRVGKAMHEHWMSKRQRQGGITSSEIDEHYAAAREAGTIGGKLVGAGGGGFLLLLCADGSEDAVRSAMKLCQLREMPFQFDFEGVRTWRV